MFRFLLVMAALMVADVSYGQCVNGACTLQPRRAPVASSTSRGKCVEERSDRNSYSILASRAACRGRSATNPRTCLLRMPSLTTHKCYDNVSVHL